MNKKSKYPVGIGDLAKDLEITTRTIRYYEEIGLMPPPERAGGGVRVYTKEEALRLKFILKLKELGLSLAEMEELSGIYEDSRSQSEVMPRLVDMLDRHIAKVDQKIAKLGSLRSELADYRKRIADIKE